MLLRYLICHRINQIRLSHVHMRTMITDADILKTFKTFRTSTLVRESRYDNNVKYLMPLLAESKFLEVKKLVKEKNINIDSHDWFENTLLTDAAKRGDVKGIQFLVTEMGANVHASCDCPHHKTPLH